MCIWLENALSLSQNGMVFGGICPLKWGAVSMQLHIPVQRKRQMTQIVKICVGLQVQVV